MINRITLVFLIFALFSGCSTAKKELASVEERATTAVSASSEKTSDDDTKNDAEAYGARIEEGVLLQPLAGPKNQRPLAQPSEWLIYFSYDSARVSPAHRATIEAHAKYLAGNPGLHITLKGHTDERGSREYNLVLGEYRAQAVKRYMVLLGASSDRIRIVSYGEEQPAADGHDESAWSKNRRVEFNY